MWKHKYYWHHPAYALLVLVQILVYVVVAMIVRQSMTVNLYLCERHRARRTRSVLIAWLLALTGLGGLIGGAVYAANVRSSDAWIGGMIAIGGFRRTDWCYRGWICLRADSEAQEDRQRIRMV